MKQRMLLLVVPALLAFPAVASASAPPPPPPSQAGEVNAVEIHADNMKQPTSDSQLTAQTAAVQPAVNQLFSQAQSSGNYSGVQTLVDKTDLPGSPAVHAAILQADGAGYETSGSTGPVSGASAARAHHKRGRGPLAHIAYYGCWGFDGQIWARWNFGNDITTAHISVISYGYCATQLAITTYEGFFQRTWTGVGYCLTNTNFAEGWLEPWWAVHGGIWSGEGVDVSYIIGGCQQIWTGHAHIREFNYPPGNWDLGY
jgi:hypothetical protein